MSREIRAPLKWRVKQVAAKVIGAKPVIGVVLCPDVFVIVHLDIHHLGTQIIPLVKLPDYTSLRITGGVGKRILPTIGQYTVPVADAEFFEPGDTRRHVDLCDVLLRVGIAGYHRPKQRQKHDDKDNDERDYGNLILSKPEKCVFKETDRFCFEGLVLDLFAANRFKLGVRYIHQLFRNLLYIDVFHFPPPILMRGSTRP